MGGFGGGGGMFQGLPFGMGFNPQGQQGQGQGQGQNQSGQKKDGKEGK